MSILTRKGFLNTINYKGQAIFFVSLTIFIGFLGLVNFYTFGEQITIQILIFCAQTICHKLTLRQIKINSFLISMKNYFKNNKIAVVFQNKEEHQVILDFFFQDDEYGIPLERVLWNRPGICSNYHERVSTFMSGGYRCCTEIDKEFKGYAVLNYNEFVTLINENISLL